MEEFTVGNAVWDLAVVAGRIVYAEFGMWPIFTLTTEFDVSGIIALLLKG
jgi:hypothetical protein